jgi:hypothetical protein
MSSYANYTYHGATDDDDSLDDTATPTEDDTTSRWVETWFTTEIGGSQLSGAPMDPTQGSQDADATPSAMPTGRPARQIIPREPPLRTHSTRLEQP